MKEELDTRFLNRLMYIGGTIILVSILAFLFNYLGLFSWTIKIFIAISPVFIAIFISFLMEPVIGFLISKGMRRNIAVIITYLLLIGIIALFFYITVPSLINQIENLINNIPGIFENLNNILSRFNIDLNDQDIQTFFQERLINFSLSTINYLKIIIGALATFFIGLSGALYLSFDFPKFKKKVKEKIPFRIKTKTYRFFETFLPFIHKYVRGTLLDSLFVFALSFVAFLLIGLNYPIVIALIITLTNLIPFIGPYIGGIFAVLLGFSISNQVGIYSLIIVILIQFIENNFIHPLILKNSIKLHPLEGILGLTLFGTLFGIVGMVISPILMVAIKILLRINDPEEIKDNDNKK